MESDLTSFENGRQPWIFQNVRQPQIYCSAAPDVAVSDLVCS